MNTKGHTIDRATNQIRNDKFSSVEQKERVDTSVEATMADIAQKLRTVYAQMQMKIPPRPLIRQSLVEEHFKSYLDDISRAILAEYYIRRQREKKLFQSLEQIKTIVQSLHSEKKNSEEVVVTRRMSRSKFPDSVVQKLAHMECEENQERLSLQKVQDFSRSNGIIPLQTNVENVLQKKNKSSLPSDVMNPPCKKKTEEVGEYAVIEEKEMDVQSSNHSIENNFSSLKVRSRESSSFLAYWVKKVFFVF
ncbi:hypothetical protein GGR08_001207 [Bartonella fuyuanensis]|uniref:Uncharacterized protein n=1 Tax=Bartonella fuyuanensis TaxID=1460968 RepID=A0A840E719_9HYPH|nr:hypothetical protein [Bartonella fuyuanensis]